MRRRSLQRHSSAIGALAQPSSGRGPHRVAATSRTTKSAVSVCRHPVPRRRPTTARSPRQPMLPTPALLTPASWSSRLNGIAKHIRSWSISPFRRLLQVTASRQPRRSIRKRVETIARKAANASSNLRRGMAWASRTPYGAANTLAGMMIAAPIRLT